MIEGLFFLSSHYNVSFVKLLTNLGKGVEPHHLVRVVSVLLRAWIHMTGMTNSENELRRAIFDDDNSGFIERDSVAIDVSSHIYRILFLLL